MTSLERLQQDLVKALKEHNADRLGVLRLLKNSLDLQQKSGAVIDDPKFMEVTQSEVKKRQDAIKLYEQAGATEKAEKEQYEIGILQEYLPAALPESELQSMIEKVIARTGAQSIADMGRIMAELKGELAGRADMGQVSGLVRTKLNG